MPQTLYVIDGHAQIFRAYYAPFPPLTSPAGEPTKATHVFCQMLFNLIRDRHPDMLAMAMDVSDRTVFRRNLFSDYKATREAPPEDLSPQIHRIASLVEMMGIPILRKEGYEADDLMATLTCRLRDEDIEIFMVSKDKDLEQLLSDRVHLYDPAKNLVMDAAWLLENRGYTPDKAIEVQTLAGDNVDNIPGVVGVGVKTAAKLINKYGSAEAVLEHADELTPKQKENVKAFAEQMPITRQLVTLRQDVEYDFDFEAMRYSGLPAARLRPVFEELGFTRLTEQLEKFDDGSAPDSDAGVGAAPSEEAAPTVPELFSEAPEKVEYTLVDTVEKLGQLTENLRDVAEFAFDTETTGLNPVASRLVGISLAWEPGQAYYIPVRSAMGAVVPLDEVIKLLGPVFADAGVRKVGQNLKYDIVVFRQAGILVDGVAFDTLIASHLLNPMRRSHGIDALAQEFCSHQMIPITDLIGKGRNQITIDEADPAAVCEYAAEDADFTWRLKLALEKQLDRSPFCELFKTTEMPLVEVLAEMEHNGVALDVPCLEAMGRDLAERMETLVKAIHKEAGYEFNIDSTKQLGAVLFDEFELPVIRKTRTLRSTDAATLEELASRTEHPIPKMVLEYREMAKLKGTYVDTLPRMVCERTNRVHASFNQTGAITGRLSSSDPNLQNIPVRTEMGRRIREAFVAGDPDCTLLVADYSQIELRILAHFSQDASLLEAFETNQDIHRFVAAQVAGIAPDEVTSQQRGAAKAVNFGIVYGQTPFGLAKSLGISQHEAKDFIDRYHARYPGIRAFIDDCIDKCRRHGYAETILGRRRPISELGSRNKQKVALGERLAVNTVVQGSAADMIKRAMIDIHTAIKDRKLATRMLIQVHDELVFEVRREDVHAHKELIREHMTGALDLNVPIVVDIGVGDNWLAAK